MEQLNDKGFILIEGIFCAEEISLITAAIDGADKHSPMFRKSNDLFAIRQFLKEIPEIRSLIFNSNLNFVITEFFGPGFFVIKSIYFDKPEESNWFVSYHQDLTISVDKKMEVPGYTCWTVKQNQFFVQPPLEILENIFTIRIHLDDTDENNGALKVIPGSHKKGIYRPETIDWSMEKEEFCKVKKGGIMIMRPLLLHSSNRTTNNNRRRVIHLEFSNRKLAEGLEWRELL